MENNQQVPWRFNGNQDVIIPEWAVGFIYVITHKVNGVEKLYVGKKILVSTRRKRIGVREKAITKTRKTFKVEKKDSGWADYWGSSKTLHEARKLPCYGTWQRTIVEWCYSKKNMSYQECRWQFMLDVMNKPSYNDHIGNWYAIDCHREVHNRVKKEREAKKIANETTNRIPGGRSTGTTGE